MKQIASTAAALLAASLLWQGATSALSQPGPGGSRPRPGFGRLGERLGDAPTSRILEMMTRRLDLTQDQQQKIGAIFEETRQSLKAQGGETREILAETRRKVGEVLTPEQKGKAEKMKSALFAGVGGYLKSHGPELKEHLQMAGEEMKLRAALSGLNLTDEQRGKLKELEDDVQTSRMQILEKVKPELEALRQDVKGELQQVLTPEQMKELKQRMSEMPGPGMGPRAGQPGTMRGPKGPRGPHGPHAGGQAGPGREDRKTTEGSGELEPADAALMQLFR